MTEGIIPRDKSKIDLRRALGEGFDKSELVSPTFVRDFEDGSALYVCPVCDYKYFVETDSRRVHTPGLFSMAEVLRRVRLPFIDFELQPGLVFNKLDNAYSTVCEVLGIHEKYDESHSSIYCCENFVVNHDFRRVYSHADTFSLRSLLAGFSSGAMSFLGEEDFNRFCEGNGKKLEALKLELGVTPVRTDPKLDELLARIRAEKK